MREGFVTDYFAHKFLRETNWIEGKPERGWLGGTFAGVKKRGKTLVPITTYRCLSCGYLESYAK
jgi:hypothetical protein